MFFYENSAKADYVKVDSRTSSIEYVNLGIGMHIFTMLTLTPSGYREIHHNSLPLKSADPTSQVKSFTRETWNLGIGWRIVTINFHYANPESQCL